MFNHFKKKMKCKGGFVFTSTVAAVTAAGLGAAAATAVGVGVTAGVIGLGAYAVNRMTQQPKTPDIGGGTPAAPSVDKAEVAAKESVDKKRRAVARNKTQFTGPLGLQAEDKSNIALKTLTGA